MKFTPFKIVLALAVAAGCCLTTCTSDKAVPDFNGYPDNIGKLVYTKCATAGCHTDDSKDAAGGLSMESWESLFKGGRGGAAVIPYRSDYSTLFFYTNTFSDLGTALTPTMPYGGAPLTRDEVTMLKDWIDSGAPSRENFVKFSDDPNRKKYYVTNQGCDIVTVFDAVSGLPMRYVNVGQTPSIESPHMVRVSPDRHYWYVISLTGLYLEKYRASDDSYVGRAFIGAGNWNAFTISDDSHTAYCTDFSNPGLLVEVNLSSMSVTATTLGDNTVGNLHGVTLNLTQDSLFVTQQIGNILYQFPREDLTTHNIANLYTGATPPAIQLNPHEIVYAPSRPPDPKRYYYVTCQNSAEVRVFEAGTNQLVTTIPVGASATEMAFSTATNYLFVSCTEDTTTFPGKRGSVAVINYKTNTFVKYIYSGHQPHGIVVDDAKHTVVVANRNSSTDGPAPHHTSACGGRNGYVTFIDMNTLEMITNPNTTGARKIELAVDPYSIGLR